MIRDLIYVLRRLDRCREALRAFEAQAREAGRPRNVRGENITLHETVTIDETAEVVNHGGGADQRIVIGAESSIASHALVVNSGGRIELGERFRAGVGSQLLSYGGTIRAGRNVVVNNYSIVYGHGGVEIGDDTQIAAHCVLIPANHRYDRLDVPISRQGETREGIRIGSNVWVGANVTVLDGVTIGDGCVVGAGSVVTRSVEPLSVVVGNPARLVRTRGVS